MIPPLITYIGMWTPWTSRYSQHQRYKHSLQPSVFITPAFCIHYTTQVLTSIHYTPCNHYNHPLKRPLIPAYNHSALVLCSPRCQDCHCPSSSWHVDHDDTPPKNNCSRIISHPGVPNCQYMEILVISPPGSWKMLIKDSSKVLIGRSWRSGQLINPPGS